MLRLAHVRPSRALPAFRLQAARAFAQQQQPPPVPLPEDLRQRVRDAPLASTYDPAVVETGWQAYWQSVIHQQGQRGKPFNMVLPPPNVTGALHIGHALTITIQDTLARWHRMRGFDVKWLPGLDHAGIATQVTRESEEEEDLLLLC